LRSVIGVAVYRKPAKNTTRVVFKEKCGIIAKSLEKNRILILKLLIFLSFRSIIQKKQRAKKLTDLEAKLFDRPEYLTQLMAFRDKKPIKIVTGIRRCGKSTLLELYKAELLKSGVANSQIQFIKLEELENEPLREYHNLYNHVKRNLVSDKMNYVFLDELQVVDGFGEVVNSLYLKGNVDVYLTGSNSKMLSKDLATQIEREYVTIHMFPLSFKEYVTAYRSEAPATNDHLYANYIQYSSFPAALNDILGSSKPMWENLKLENGNFIDMENIAEFQPMIKKYLSDLYDKIVLKDIVANKGITDIGRLERVIRFLADNISRSEMSIDKMAKAMTADGHKIDTHTLEKYIDALCDSYLVYHVNRYDIKGKQQLKTNGKYYLVDIGLRYLLLGDKGADTGHILENVVYLELCRRAGAENVWIGKVDAKDKEVDFVVDGKNGREYYQVTQTMRNETTKARELSSLEMVSDHNPKYILTRDIEPAISFNGIKQLNVLEWLVC
jgi:predicted AAA+ superfamily ATPase